MLNRLLLENQITQALTREETWFEETFNEVLDAWNSIQKLSSADFDKTIQPLTSWNGALNNNTLCALTNTPYTIYAIDGSQIYPDRHFGINVALINIGFAGFEYGNITSRAYLGSLPSLYTRQDLPQELQQENLHESTADALRSVHEFKHATTLIPQRPDLLMFDGSLIFWHLGTPEHPAPHASYFLQASIAPLQELSQNKIAYCSYISSPKSRDLIELIWSRKPELKSLCYGYTDADVLLHTLPDMHYTPLFKSHAPITKEYPAEIHPHFLYLKIYGEIGRIELPYWLTQEPSALRSKLTYTADQIIKGKGYPIALAEAHEQAVIKEYDRQFLLQHLTKQKRTDALSKKQSHKQRPII